MKRLDDCNDDSRGGKKSGMSCQFVNVGCLSSSLESEGLSTLPLCSLSVLCQSSRRTPKGKTVDDEEGRVFSFSRGEDG